MDVRQGLTRAKARRPDPAQWWGTQLGLGGPGCGLQGKRKCRRGQWDYWRGMGSSCRGELYILSLLGSADHGQGTWRENARTR